MRMRFAPVIAHERHEPRAEHIERCHAGGQDAEPVNPGMIMIRADENLVFAEETRCARDARNRDAGEEERPTCYGDSLAQTAHLPEVLLAAERMDDAACAKEEQRLEERMRHQMEDARAEQIGR